MRDPHDAPLVAALRGADALLIGKSNVPQLMILHEADNPLYGKSLHPLDPRRSPGGSSGGEGALSQFLLLGRRLGHGSRRQHSLSRT